MTQSSHSSAAPLFDAYKPAQIAERVRDVGVAKANTSTTTLLALAVLAGAFISLGALFYLVTITTNAGEAATAFGVTRLMGGAAFSLGLILVVVGGAELFTGNNLIAMAWASGEITTRQVARNWGWVYLGNLAGAVGTVALVAGAGIHTLGDGAVGDTAVRIANAKVALSPVEVISRGILCNVLVCLAVWLCTAARGVADKILAILFPISAFVACGFEHSVANMFFLPLGVFVAGGGGASISWLSVGENLLFATIGNIIGGTLLVAMVYWFVYLREKSCELKAID
ncbi:MAG: formate/nitrite transporter family protein [Nitrospirae bacterium]|nr:formate/nitrite transporter family protein [Nitrospirota bacterium]